MATETFDRMAFVGQNVDSSGMYNMYVDGNVLVTTIGNGITVDEVFRQTLVEDNDFTAPEDEWYDYSLDGQSKVLLIHMYGENAIVYGANYRLEMNG